MQPFQPVDSKDYPSNIESMMETASAPIINEK